MAGRGQPRAAPPAATAGSGSGATSGESASKRTSTASTASMLVPDIRPMSGASSLRIRKVSDGRMGGGVPKSAMRSRARRSLPVSCAPLHETVESTKHDGDGGGIMDIIKRGAQELLIESELIERLGSGRHPPRQGRFRPDRAGPAPRPHRADQQAAPVQELGHEVLFLIGDFTGMIGDPTGKNVTRRPRRARRCSPTPRPTASRCSDPRPRPTQVLFNSAWYDTIGAGRLHPARMRAAHLARMLERDDFSQALRRRPADRDP